MSHCLKLTEFLMRQNNRPSLHVIYTVQDFSVYDSSVLSEQRVHFAERTEHCISIHQAFTSDEDNDDSLWRNALNHVRVLTLSHFPSSWFGVLIKNTNVACSADEVLMSLIPRGRG